MHIYTWDIQIPLVLYWEHKLFWMARNIFVWGDNTNLTPDQKYKMYRIQIEHLYQFLFKSDQKKYYTADITHILRQQA